MHRQGVMKEYGTIEISEKVLKKLQRDLLVTRIFSMILSILMIGILVGGFYMFRTVQTYAVQVDGYVTDIMTYAENMEPAIEQLSEVDIETLNDTMEQMTVAFAEVDFEKLAQQIDDLDVEAINAKVAALDVDALNDKVAALDVDALNAKINALDIEGINKAIEELDTAELSEALTNLNDASEKVREISEKLKQVASIFTWE